ncbi:MAG: DNA recombination protein RmuC [Candidatus Micrarchaeia archaeon]
MDVLTLVLFAIVVIVVALISFLAGYFFGKNNVLQKTDIREQMSIVSQLNAQMAEVKANFIQLEKRREESEKAHDKNSKDRDKQWQDFITSIQVNMGNMSSQLGQFQKLVLGTSQRGKVGEELLKVYLKEAIKGGMIKTNLNTGNGEVEFALNLQDGKFIPIDSKLPDVYELLEKMEKADQKEQLVIKKQIKSKIERCIDDVVKYQNQPKTIDKCILSVPDNLVDMYPEMMDLARKKNVYLTGHSFTYLLSSMLYEEYARLKAQGDLGQYRQNVRVLLGIIDEIMIKTERIDKGLKMAQKASEEIAATGRNAKKSVD